MLTIEAHSSHVNCARFSPDSSFVVSAGFSGELRAWDPESAKLIREYSGHEKSVNSVAFFDDQELLVSGSADGTLIVWDAESGKPLKTWTDLSKGIGSVAVTGDETIVASGPQTMLHVRTWPDGNVVNTVKPVSKNLSVLALSGDRKTAVIGGLGSTVFYYSMADGSEIGRLETGEKAIMSFRYSDSNRFYIYGYSGELVLRSTSDEILATYKGPGGYGGVAVAPGGRTVAMSSSEGISILSTNDLSLIKKIPVKAKGNYGLSFSPDGGQLALASADKRVRIWTREELL